MSNLMNAKQLNQKIGGVKKSVASLRENIHEILCHAAGHAYEHGDVSAFTRLYDVTTGADRHAIGRWVSEYGFGKLKANGSFALDKKAKNNADFADGEAVMQYLTDHVEPWYAFAKSKAQVASDLDMEKQIRSLMKRVQKTIEDGDRDVVVPLGTRKAIAELGDMVEAIREKRAEADLSAGDDEAKDVTPEPLMIAAQ